MTYPQNTVTLTLDFPLTLSSGDVITSVTMRSPRVIDRINRNRDTRSDIEADITMIASLCGMQEADILNMEGCDYLRLEGQFNLFLLPVAARKKAQSLPEYGGAAAGLAGGQTTA
ncbi:phage tail assembly protein [Enterobacter roggenkampii]|uniref:phage tail assembly protein n=1 Tax=Enterobacter roggenkampii TaxID=1812935 RepID=UPI002238441C|nr:phage tail assembly protein [Enterobacter roggenkampii]MCW5003542.1 phage tail assembly protein [Enterobacter roggenkampii]